MNLSLLFKIQHFIYKIFHCNSLSPLAYFLIPITLKLREFIAFSIGDSSFGE